MIQIIQPTGLTPLRLATIVASRFVLNTIFRVTYPLTQFVILRTQLSEQVVAWLVTVQVLAGLIGPLSGWLGDRFGYRRTMAAGLLLATLGATVVALSRNFAVLLLGFVLAGLGSALYQPTMQAYVSEWTPLRQRGRALGAIEVSWALAGILGVPAVVWLVTRSQDFGLGFGMLAGLLLLLLTTILWLPPDRQATNPGERSAFSWGAVLRQPSVIALCGFLWLALCGEEILFIVQPSWLHSQFNASVATVAQSLIVFGWGELGGSLLAMLLTDRLGVRRAPILGFGLSALVYIALPILSTSWTAYLICFACFALCFEFAIVSAFSLVSSIDPQARGSVIALAGTAIQTGRAVGSQVGVALLPLTGLGLLANGLVAAALTILGIALVLIFVHPREQA